MKIPLIDLSPQHRRLRSQFNRAIQNVLTRSDFILGEDLRQFESEFARFTGTRYAIGVSSGLDAIRLALTALGIGAGDEVIIPAHTYIATALAVSHTGAVPRLVDVQDDSFNIDPSKIEAAITSRTKAIMPVHIFGQPADMSEILAIAGRHKLAVVEDACQAHGAHYHGKRVGSLGDAGCFSFYPSKNLGALGDGGIVTTNDQQLAQKIDRLRNYGQSQKYIHDDVGYNNRLDTLQAALLRVKLNHLDRWNKQRRTIARAYDKAFAKLPLQIPELRKDRDHVYHLYSIRSPQRDGLKQHLTERGIASGIYYPVPMHLQKAYRSLGHKEGSFPVTERISRDMLALPMYPDMTAAQVKKVIATVKEFFRPGRSG